MSDHEPSVTCPVGPPLAGAPRTTSSTRRRSLLLLASAATLFAVGAALTWWMQADAPETSAQPATPPATGVVTTAMDSHRPLDSLALGGMLRSLPADPALEAALSLTSRLEFRNRLDVVHKLAGTTLTAAQADFLRSFVADPAIPEGLTIQQVRALKNDVLNVLCLHPGGERATAAVLRSIHENPAQDAGLRDYALQHTVTLIERDPAVGWDLHWKALDSSESALAATAMLHLSGLQREEKLTTAERSRLETAALRIAGDTAGSDISRTTALQLCGRLKLTEARPLALELAQSDRTGFPLRIAAVATLGDLGGDESTRTYLTSLLTGPERRLRVPAESALKRFSIN